MGEASNDGPLRTIRDGEGQNGLLPCFPGPTVVETAARLTNFPSTPSRSPNYLPRKLSERSMETKTGAKGETGKTGSMPPGGRVPPFSKPLHLSPGLFPLADSEMMPGERPPPTKSFPSTDGTRRLAARRALQRTPRRTVPSRPFSITASGLVQLIRSSAYTIGLNRIIGLIRRAWLPHSALKMSPAPSSCGEVLRFARRLLSRPCQPRREDREFREPRIE